jgi:TonB family protein
MTRTIVIIALLLASVGGPRVAGAQGSPAATSPGTASLSGTLYDPLGQPADHVTLTLGVVDGVDPRTLRTDANGRYRFEGIQPARLWLTTPATDFVTPAVIEVKLGENALDVHLGVDETAATWRVCANCKAADWTLPGSIRGSFTSTRDEASVAIVSPAEPEEGWDAFNERPLPYSAAMKASKLEGTVTIDGKIMTDGTSASLQVRSSTDPRLTDAALALVQQQRWRPARVRTTPVDVPLHATVEFSIYGD